MPEPGQQLVPNGTARGRTERGSGGVAVATGGETARRRDWERLGAVAGERRLIATCLRRPEL